MYLRKKLKGKQCFYYKNCHRELHKLDPWLRNLNKKYFDFLEELVC